MNENEEKLIAAYLAGGEVSEELLNSCKAKPELLKDLAEITAVERLLSLQAVEDSDIFANEVKERLKNSDEKIIDIDGVRVENDEGWFLMRASNTQNQLTCRAESTSENGLLKLIEIIEHQLSLSGVSYKFTI